MFWTNYWNGWTLKGARTVEQKCCKCGNTGNHFVYVLPKGHQLGLIFLKKPLIGRRQYFLVCPTCAYLARELTKQQAQSMMGA